MIPDRAADSHESAIFWVTLGGGVAVIGGILVTVGVTQTLQTPGAPLWASHWFQGGLVVVGIGALALIWALLLHRRGPFVGRSRAAQTVPTAPIHLASQVEIGQISGGEQHFHFNTPPDRPPPDQSGTPSWMNERHLTDRSLRVMDITRDGRYLRDRVFERCTIYGPAVLALVGTGAFENCGFAGSADEVLWEVTNPWLLKAGVIPVERCTFRSCQFAGVTFVIDHELMQRFLANTEVREGPNQGDNN